MILRRLLVVAAAVSALVSTGCAAESVSTETPRTETPRRQTPVAKAGEATSALAGPGAKLLSFRAPAIGGGEVDASVYQGRPTLLWFWAPW